MRTALVMLPSLMTGVEGKEGDTWLDYAMMSMLILNVVGALSVAMGLWKFLQWWMKEKATKEETKKTRTARQKKRTILTSSTSSTRGLVNCAARSISGMNRPKP